LHELGYAAESVARSIGVFRYFGDVISACGLCLPEILPWGASELRGDGRGTFLLLILVACAEACSLCGAPLWCPLVEVWAILLDVVSNTIISLHAWLTHGHLRREACIHDLEGVT